MPQEMTEEGIPLLILFYHPDNPETKELFKQKVETDLSEHKGNPRQKRILPLIASR